MDWKAKFEKGRWRRISEYILYVSTYVCTYRFSGMNLIIGSEFYHGATLLFLLKEVKGSVAYSRSTRIAPGRGLIVSSWVSSPPGVAFPDWGPQDSLYLVVRRSASLGQTVCA